MLTAVLRRLRDVVRFRVVLWTQPRFLVGVVSVLRSPDGRILLLENRFWHGNRWGCPSGHMRYGESPEAAARRELSEECGLVPSSLEVARVSTGYVKRIEIWCLGTVAIQEAPIHLQRLEITDAALLPPAEALARMRPSQAAVVRQVLGTSI
ncbi:NUDIX hydrolase [Brachybacterium sp. AOP25-B2-12]|uniref:NUDIX hydrolase n=1 Tax=Brachybacterium sp. AOP25-B2-12 TaxID=3457710 RepID=UPI004034DC83